MKQESGRHMETKQTSQMVTWLDEERRKDKALISKLEERIAPKITAVQINGGGNTPNGNANGVPETNVNPAGQAPPGQN